MIFVVDDDEIMAECVARAVPGEVRVFSNGIEAMAAIAEGELPEMIFLEIMLTGPDGFTFLNELASYTDTAKIPVVVISALDFDGVKLDDYGVVGVLNKARMTPEEIRWYAERY